MTTALTLMAEPAERRREPRHSIGADVTFASETQELGGNTCDVSLRGACVVAFRMMPVRTPVRVRLTLPHGVAYIDATIRWVHPGTHGGPGRFGLEWTHLSDVDRSLLLALGAPRPISRAVRRPTLLRNDRRADAVDARHASGVAAVRDRLA